MKLLNKRKIEFTPQGKKILIVLILVAIVVGGLFIGIASCSSSNQNSSVDTSKNSSSSDGFNLNKGNYSSDYAISKENVEGFEKLSSLSESAQNMFLSAVGNKFCSSTSVAQSLKITLLGDLVKQNNISNIYFKNQRDKKYYTASIYESRVTITELTQHVKGINDELYDETAEVQSKSTRTSNEGEEVQTDTTGNIFITNTQKLEKVLPSNAAKSLSDSLSSWCKEQGTEIALYQSTLNPSSVTQDGSVTNFNCLCFGKSDVNAVLVKCSYDSSANQFSFAFA